MPEYLAPGVYVEEIDTGAKTIEGVSTSTAGFVGCTRRGPTVGLPVLVTSFGEFQRQFGGYFDLGLAFQSHRFLPFAVDGFFNNGGKRLYVLRVKGALASAATTTTAGGMITRLRPGEDAALGQPKFKPLTLRGITGGTIIRLRTIKDGVTYESANLTVAANGVDPVTGEVTVTANLTIAPAAGAPVAFEARSTAVLTDVDGLDAAGLPTALALITNPRAATFAISARDEGSWGKEVVVQAGHETSARAEVDTLPAAFIAGAIDGNKIRLKSTAGFYPNAWVEIDRGNSKRYRRVKAVDGNVLTLFGPVMTAANVTPQAPATVTVFSVAEFRITASYGGVVEQFPGLTLENVPGKFYVDRIVNGSTLITVGVPAANTHPFMFPSGADGVNILLDTGGVDAAPTAADYKGTDPGLGLRTGIKALEDIDQISIIAAPGVTDQLVVNALIEQCERLKDRFAILDPQPKAGNIAPNLTDIMNQRNLYDTKYAAIYYPRLLAYDPTADTDIPIPPSGHMTGIYARTDIERGVHKAPANEVIRAISGLELAVNKGAHDILNPSPVNINVLRDFRSDGRGYRVWGARCITSDTSWKYINVRRLFIFLEESLDEGTQWVVFEPNDEPLWERVRQSVSHFLTRVWRDGALQGAKPEEAFFVKCDRTTMTQDDIDNGKLIMIIGVAPVKPAEFVIIRIGQWAGGSQIDEG